MKMCIKEIRTRLGLKQKDLVEVTGLSNPYLSALETGNVKKSPSIETLTTIAEALGVRVGDLFDDAKLVPIVGRVGQGARVFLSDTCDPPLKPHRIVSPSRHLNGCAVGVEIEGDGAAPVYKEGDVLFYSQDIESVPRGAIGSICVCEDSDGNCLIRQVKGGGEPGKFHLISLNPVVTDNIFDVQLERAAPVILHWPRAMVERV